MLILQVISHHKNSLGPDYQVSFDKLGGTVGRSLGNEWVLPDPERVVSGEHAAIVYSNGTYLVEDVSTNGIYVGDADEPIGNGNRIELRNGDILHIGDYEILVTIGSAAPVESFSDAPLTDDTEHGVPATDVLTVDSSAWASEAAIGSLLGDAETALSDGADQVVISKASQTDDPLAKPEFKSAFSEADHRRGDLQFFQLPEANAECIPEDWDLNESLANAGETQNAPPLHQGGGALSTMAELGDSKPGARPAVPSPTQRLQTTAAATPAAQKTQSSGDQQSHASMVGTAVDDVITAFMRGVGLDLSEIEQMTPAERLTMMEKVGQTYRCMVEGMLDIMIARARLKREFRLDVTMIRPAENNPLKFSVDSDDALQHLLFQRSSGFMLAEQAFSEAFTDLKEHEMAIVAGMRAVFNQTMDRFDPKQLETAFANSVSGGLVTVLGGRESRYWSLYKQEYERLASEAREHFLDFFGAEFAKAYERQIRNMACEGNES